MLIVNQIENTHFSKTEREIVDYIIDQGMNIEKMSANEIARNTFTSAPLLVRIAKKLGYSGFNEFKSAYLKELAYMLEETDVDASIPFLLSDDLMTISKNIALLEKETIQDTEQLNHHDELQHAISLLEKTKKIDVYGVLDNILLAKHFQTLMMDIGKDVQVIDQVTGQKRSACLADETHCAIIISYSGQTEEMLEVAEIYYKRQIPFISITCMAENSLSIFLCLSLRLLISLLLSKNSVPLLHLHLLQPVQVLLTIRQCSRVYRFAFLLHNCRHSHVTLFRLFLILPYHQAQRSFFLPPDLIHRSMHT